MNVLTKIGYVASRLSEVLLHLFDFELRCRTRSLQIASFRFHASSDVKSLPIQRGTRVSEISDSLFVNLLT